ncbi:hypothetical protein EXIGLDRAFT_777848 [Exidia glandulosa HHB12029]|uniref:Heparinase II/III-like C-terminal domain-containing protein n=1 Tax=Exidia glandulosa HHB12029 TaxID=1314781 RepID=A0A165CUJ5_EXIGL|nr:hypothetical protein EXIGLDRAFT_777848 [Exidia glandulosa HHB12029]
MYRTETYDSAQRPLTNVQYSKTPNPYAEEGYYNNSTAYLAQPYSQPPPPRKKGVSKWVKIGIPVIILLIAAAVVVAVIVSRNSKDDKAASSSSGNGTTSGDGGTPAAPGTFPTAVDSYFLPVYPTAANAELFVAPAFATAGASAAWPAETFTPSNPSPLTVRPDRPRIIAPKYKWDALPDLIEKDPYMKAFHNQILKNASAYWSLPVVKYVEDGGLTGSGILDVSREIKMRIKAYAYAYRMEQDSKWLDAAWKELDHASGNQTDAPFGTAPDRWNSKHFLDLAEMTAAFGIAYDWLYDAWTPDQRNALMWSIINTGLAFGTAAHDADNWWTKPSITGNWNCVCNSGLTIGALAILGDDPTGTAEAILSKTIDDAKSACVNAPSSDGSWTETPNYWYFGTTGHAEMTSALLTATGSHYGLADTNPSFANTGYYHMYVFGMTSLFDYADHGPNKFSTTANGMMLYSTLYNEPRYMLHQRDRFDAPEPWSMFWYDPTVTGAWWNGLPLDRYFSDPETNWVSMRSSWTDNKGLYIAMKSSKLQQHQAHGDLDCGDFVLDAMGERWFGELGSGDYLSFEYFKSEDDDAARWLYYRKRTEGQNTILINNANQVAEANPPQMNFGTTKDAQGADPVMSLSSSSTAYAVTDMSSAYPQSTVKRGIRMINGRKQVLLQDDISTTVGPIMWRAHTNATVATSGSTATLTLNGKTLTATILSPSGASFTTAKPVRLASDPPLPPNNTDQLNKDVTVLVINLEQGTQSLQVLFNPQWDGMSSSDFVSPSSVSLDNWSLTSHS